MTHAARSGFMATLAVAVVLSVASPGLAAQGAARPSPGQQVQAAPVLPGPASGPGAVDVDARQTREQLYTLLEKYPPSLGRVLKLDPSLMLSDTYLAPYPVLGAFLAKHPEVAHNPSFFLERVSISTSSEYEYDQGAMRRRETGQMFAAFAAFLVFLVVTGVIVWVVRTIIGHRRWNRVSKTQFDVHSKLLERFSTNQELLTYIQTPVGRRFLESGPTPLPYESRPVGGTFSRILWSVQTGIVLTIAAVGLLFLSWRLDADPSLFFMVIGVVTLALGGGFMASGAAAYVLSRRLGLLDSPDSSHA